MQLPYGSQTVQVQANTDPTRTALITYDNAGAPLPLTLYADNWLHVNDSLDGAYTFTLHFSQPNITRVCISSRQVTLLSSPGCAQGSTSVYAGAQSGATLGSQALSWSAPQRFYSLLVPYIMQQIDFRVEVGGLNNAVTVEQRPSAARAYTLQQPSLQFQLAPGSNDFSLNSTLDGYYALQFVRAQPDLQDLRVQPVTASTGFERPQRRRCSSRSRSSC